MAIACWEPATLPYGKDGQVHGPSTIAGRHVLIKLIQPSSNFIVNDWRL